MPALVKDSPAPLLQDSPAWFCLRSKTKTEHLAASQVHAQLGLEVFCPRVRFRRTTKRGRVWFVEALFPGYFFAWFNPRDHLRAAIHSPGVTGIVAFGGLPVAVPDIHVAGLRELVDASGVREIPEEISVGTETEIVRGPFRGLQAVVSKVMPSKERVRILLEFLGSIREIEVDLAQLASPKPLPKDFSR